MGRRARNELQALANAARSQLALASHLGDSLRARMKVKQEAAQELGWIPDEEWRRDFASVTNTLQHAGNSLVRALEGRKKQLGGKSEDELTDEVRTQIAQEAAAIPDDVWEAMQIARARKGQS